MARIQFWAMPNSEFQSGPLLRSHIREFEQSNPGIEVDVSIRTASSIWKYLLMLLKRPERASAEQIRPDLVQIPSHWTSTLAQLGLLEELSGIAAAPVDDGLPLLKEQCLLSGTSRVFSLPWFMEVVVLYYRRDLFKKDRLDPEKFLRTWDGLSEYCRIASRKRKANRRFYPIANSNPREAVSLADIASSVWAQGGDFFASNGSRSLFHREEAMKGIAAYVDLLAKGWMPLLRKSGQIPEDLFSGHCSLQFSGRRHRGLSPRFGKSLGAMGCLGGLAGRAGTVTAQHLAIVRDSAVKTETQALLRYLTAFQTAKRYGDLIGVFPAVKNWLETSFSPGDPIAGAFRETFERARTLPNLTAMATLEQIFDRNMERVVGDILRGNFRQEAMRQELLYAAAEIDYVLTLNA